MALKKDKQKVLGEIFDDERIRGFLEGQLPKGLNLDFYLLERAYRGMREENFATFVEFFVAAGHDINTKNSDGRTLIELVREHAAFAEYVEILEKFGAN